MANNWCLAIAVLGINTYNGARLRPGNFLTTRVCRGTDSYKWVFDVSAGLLLIYISSIRESTVVTVERTISIIKPDAVAKNVIGEIIARFEQAGLNIVAAKMLHLSQEQAEGFYAEHKERPFFGALVEFMTSGPVVVQVLQGENAIQKNRDLMGATNPQEAEAGTIRADFAQSIDANAVHGSDSPASAEREIAYFFNDSEICPR